MVKKIDENTFRELVDSTDKYIVADFYASWCGPCSMIAPVLEEISEEYSDVEFVKIDVDDANKLAIELKISSIPCIVAFKDGEEYARSVGYVSKDQLKLSLGL